MTNFESLLSLNDQMQDSAVREAMFLQPLYKFHSAVNKNLEPRFDFDGLSIILALLRWTYGFFCA